MAEAHVHGKVGFVLRVQEFAERAAVTGREVGGGVDIADEHGGMIGAGRDSGCGALPYGMFGSETGGTVL